MQSRIPVRFGVICMVVFSLFAATLPAFANHGEEASVSQATTVHTTEHDDNHHEVEQIKTSVTLAVAGDSTHAQTMQALLGALQKLLVVLEQKHDLLVSEEAMHDDDHHEEVEHSHAELYEVKTSVPTLEVEVTPGLKGYAVHAQTTNFTFAPELADGEHVDNHGHAHIYLDGVKISRMYAPWFYLSEITEAGEHTVRVELSTNDHKTYAHDGEMIDDTIVIEVK